MVYQGYRKDEKNPIILSLMVIVYSGSIPGITANFDKAIHFAKAAHFYNKKNVIKNAMLKQIASFIVTPFLFADDSSPKNDVCQSTKLINNHSLLANFCSDQLYYMSFYISLLDGDFEKAFKCIDYFIEKGSSVSFYLLGEVYLAKKEYKDGLNNFRYFIYENKELLKNHNVFNSNLENALLPFSLEKCGDLYFHFGNIQKAISFYENAIKFGSTAASYSLGLIYYDKKEYKTAYSTFETGYLNTTQPNLECLRIAGYIMHNFLKTKKEDDAIAVKLYKRALSLGCYSAAVDLCKLYIDNDNLIYALSTIDRYINEDFVYFETLSKLRNTIYEKKKGAKSLAFSFLNKLNSSYENNELLFSKINLYIRKKLDRLTISNKIINEEILNQFSIGIYNCICALKTNTDVDFSSAINPLSKGVEILLKEYLVLPYSEYMKKNCPQHPLVFLNENSEGEIRFCLSDLWKKRMIFKDYRGNNKQTVIFDTFLDFADEILIIGKTQKKSYIRRFVSELEEFNIIRNLATHALPLSINQVEQCLDILFFERKTIIKFVQKLK